MACAAFVPTVIVQAQQPELTLKDVLQLLKHRNANSLTGTLMERGVDFDLTPKIAEKLRKAGADDETLATIWRATPVGRTTPAALFTGASGAEIKANFKEAEAYAAIQDEPDSQVRLRMVDEFAQELPQSPLLPYVYAQAAKVYQAQGNYAQTLDYAQRSLKLDPHNIFGLILAAMVLPEPRMLQGSSAENARHLTEAENDAHQALDLIAALPQRQGETAEVYQRRKNALAADAHYALGMVSMARDQFDLAAAEYQKAIAAAVKPAPQYYYRLGEAYASDGKTADAIQALAKASELGRGTVVGQFADQMIQQLKTQK